MAKITKVVFLLDALFGQRDYDRYGIETLQQNGFEVEVWDFTPFLHPQAYQQGAPDPVCYEGYHPFLTRNEALQAISNLGQHCFVVCIVAYSDYSLKIYRALAKNKIKYGVYLSLLPSVLQKTGKLTMLLHRLKKLLALNYLMVYVRAQLRGILRRIPYAYLGIEPATLIFAGGEKFNVYVDYPISEKSEVVWVHHWDYDLYLKEKQQPVEVNPNTGVFLDQYIPFHTDFSWLGVAPTLSVDEYYPLLCRFFDFLEANYEAQIVIAAHPRSDYEKRSDYFGGRPVIKGKSLELCRKAGFVILHNSTAINFAVLFNKPLIFITTDRLQQSPIDRTWIETMASSLGKNIFNISNLGSINWEAELKVDEATYLAYKNDYIKKNGSEELPIWQIVANRLKQF